MDGDLRSRWRRPEPAVTSGDRWSYSATIPADLGHPVTAPASRVDTHPPRRESKPADPVEAEKADEADDADGKKDGAKAKQPMPRWKKLLFWLIALAILGTLITAGTLYYLDARHYESTDDAFVDGHNSQIAAQVSARVISLAVKDNEYVHAGQTLLELDPRDFQVKLDQADAQRAQADAQVAQARAQLGLQQANLDQALAQVRVAEAELGQQQTDLARYRAIDPKAITRQQLDTAGATTKSAAARLDANKQAVAGARAMIDAQQAQVDAAIANLNAVAVTVRNAKLQLGYTTVTALTDGRVTRRTVETGNYVNAGQALLAIVSDDLWVTANFKETQLADMREGQHVRIRIDACPGKDIDGEVQSFQYGTGAVFSSLPAENATGNYVKVIQRVPVKIVFLGLPKDCRLALGLSVSPRATVR